MRDQRRKITIEVVNEIDYIEKRLMYDDDAVELVAIGKPTFSNYESPPWPNTGQVTEKVEEIT